MVDIPKPDLIKTTEIFLVPSSFLVAALGTADTNIHRAAVSLLGLIISGLWWVCTRDALQEFLQEVQAGGEQKALPRRTRVLAWLPAIFCSGWLFSTMVHASLWNRPLIPS